MKAAGQHSAIAMAAMVMLSAYSVRADENKTSPVPVATGAPFTFAHTWHGAEYLPAPGEALRVHVTMVYNNTTVYNEFSTDVGFEPSSALIGFSFRGGFPIPKMPNFGNLAVYLALVPSQTNKNGIPPNRGELAFVLVQHCPKLLPHQAPVCQYATAEDWAIITPVK